jgi:hypothetical protein
MPQSIIQPDFGFVFSLLRYSDFSPVPILDPPSISVIYAVMRFLTSQFKSASSLPLSSYLLASLAELALEIKCVLYHPKIERILIVYS